MTAVSGAVSNLPSAPTYTVLGDAVTVGCSCAAQAAARTQNVIARMCIFTKNLRQRIQQRSIVGSRAVSLQLERCKGNCLQGEERGNGRRFPCLLRAFGA